MVSNDWNMLQGRIVLCKLTNCGKNNCPYKDKLNKTGVINDTLGQTHSLVRKANIVFTLFCLLDFEKWTDGHTNGRRLRKQ